MKLVQPEAWRPRGIDDLEPSAWRALRHCGSTCVVAGPGAGKTEFLAQRAATSLKQASALRPLKSLRYLLKAMQLRTCLNVSGSGVHLNCQTDSSR